MKIVLDNKDYRSLIKELGQERIMEFYLGIEVALGRLYVSPLRPDNHPTCSFYYTESGNLRFNDFGTSDNLGVMDVIMRRFKLSFAEACRRLESDSPNISTSKVDPLIKEEITLSYQKGNLSANLEFWHKFGITEEMLRKYDVNHVKTVYRTKGSHRDKLFVPALWCG